MPYRIQKPDYPKVHLASYAVIRDRDEFLLVFHAKAKAWIPVGGHLDANERSKDAIAREVEEELGVGPDYVAPKPFYVTSREVHDDNYSHTDITFWHLVELRRSKLGPQTIDQDEELRWFGIDRIAKMRDRSGLRGALKALGVIKKPARGKTVADDPTYDMAQILI